MKKRFNLAQSGKHLDIYLYGVIGSWWDGVDLNSFLEQLKSVDNPDTVAVYINSLGGSFLDGIPIFTHLGILAKKTQMTVNIMGYALSMGSVLALVPNAKIAMAQNGLIMHHRALTIAFGNVNDLQKEIEILQKYEAGITKLYAQRLNISEKEALALMDEETWYTADEALSAGLIDEIIDPIDLSQAVEEAANGSDANKLVSNYHHLPNELTLLLGSPKKNGLFDLFFKKQPAAAFSRSVNLSPDLEIEMTKEEVQALVKASADESAAALKAEFEQKLNSATEGLKAELAAEKEKTVALQNTVAELNATLEELSQPLPGTNVPANTGAATVIPEEDRY